MTGCLCLVYLIHIWKNSRVLTLKIHFFHVWGLGREMFIKLRFGSRSKKCKNHWLKTYSFETILIWNRTHLRPYSFETVLIWDRTHLKPYSFETVLIWDHTSHTHLRPYFSYSFETILIWDHIHLRLFIWDHVNLRPIHLRPCSSQPTLVWDVFICDAFLV